MRLTIDEIVIKPGAFQVRPPAPFEARARCGRYHRLIRIGRLWLQPEHECRGWKRKNAA